MKSSFAMKKKGEIVGITATIFVAFAILLTSVFKITTPKYAYSQTELSGKQEIGKPVQVDYQLAYPGKIHPDSMLWYVKVVRDKLWYTFTFDKGKKTELNLLFADKRLSCALELFKKHKPDLGLSTLTKAEKYLEKAVPTNADDSEYLKKVALASLMHREVIENQILPLSPEDIAPKVNKINDYSKETYKKARDLMYSKGLVPPENVFESK